MTDRTITLPDDVIAVLVLPAAIPTVVAFGEALETEFPGCVVRAIPDQPGFMFVCRASA